MRDNRSQVGSPRYVGATPPSHTEGTASGLQPSLCLTWERPQWGQESKTLRSCRKGLTGTPKVRGQKRTKAERRPWPPRTPSPAQPHSTRTPAPQVPISHKNSHIHTSKRTDAPVTRTLPRVNSHPQSTHAHPHPNSTGHSHSHTLVVTLTRTVVHSPCRHTQSLELPHVSSHLPSSTLNTGSYPHHHGRARSTYTPTPIAHMLFLRPVSTAHARAQAPS